MINKTEPLGCSKKPKSSLSQDLLIPPVLKVKFQVQSWFVMCYNLDVLKNKQETPLVTICPVDNNNKSHTRLPPSSVVLVY